MKDRTYEEYVVVFLDILGFSDKISSTINDPTGIKRILDMLAKAKQWVSFVNKNDSDEARPVIGRMFSDTIVLSCADTGIERLKFIFSFLSLFQATIVQEGYFFRGAAVVGDHYEEGEIMFGPAILQAYEIEKLAVWPRVVIDQSAFRGTGMKMPESLVSNVFLRGEGGLVYLDYLCTAFVGLTTSKWLRELGSLSIPDSVAVDLFALHKSAILQAVNNPKAQSDINVLTKYHRLAEYHNNVIRTLDSQFEYSVKHSSPYPGTHAEALYNFVLGSESQVGNLVPKYSTESWRSKFWNLANDKPSRQSSLIDLPLVFPNLYSEK